MDILSTLGIVLGSNVATVIVTSYFNRKKTSAEATDVAISGTVKWAESMRKDIERLSEDIDEIWKKYEEVLKENFDLKARILHLETELAKYKK